MEFLENNSDIAVLGTESLGPEFIEYHRVPQHPARKRRIVTLSTFVKTRVHWDSAGQARERNTERSRSTRLSHARPADFVVVG